MKLRPTLALLAVTAPLLAGGSALPCRYTIRDIGFLDLGGPEYELVVHPAWQGRMEGLEERFASSNVRARLATESDATPGAPYVLQRPGLPPLGLTDPAEVLPSTFRDRLLKTTLSTYAQLVLVHDDFGEKSDQVGEAVQGALDQLRSIEAHLPTPPGARMYTAAIAPGTRERERVLLWAAGLHDLAADEPAIIVLYGRGKLAGEPLRGESVSADRLLRQLALLGESCECESDRAWLEQPRVPLDWPDDVRGQANQALGFEPESPLVLSEVRNVLAKGGPQDHVDEQRISELLFGYRESGANAVTPVERPETPTGTRAAPELIGAGAGDWDFADEDGSAEEAPKDARRLRESGGDAELPPDAGGSWFLLILCSILAILAAGGIVLRRRK